MFLLVGGEELRHAVCRQLVHVAGLTGVAIGVVDGAERFFAFGVCAVPQFAHVLCVAVDVCEEGFESAHVFDCCRVAAADCAVPFVIYESGAVAAHADGDGHVIEVADVFGGGGLRVSEGVRRSLYSGEGVSVALSVVARDGSSVVLDDEGVRRVLRGRPVASSWDVDSVLGSFESSFDRRAGEWVAGAGEVVLPPSGWDDWMEPVVGDDDDE